MKKMPYYHYFVAFDFKIPDRDNLVNAIKGAFEGTSMIGYYADLEVKANGKHIFNKIEEMILSTEFGLYEISTNNQNVSLELGLAKGAKKRFYILAKKGTEIPSDLKGMDRIQYDDYHQLTEEIRKKIVLVEKNRIEEKEDTLLNRYDNIAEQIVIEKAYRLYQAEDLLHQFGSETEDIYASNKKAWCANLLEKSSHFIYGPYNALPATGNYIAYFKIKISDNSFPGQLLFLDVVGAGRGGRVLRSKDFKEPNKYELFSIKFGCESLGPMEYRVMNLMQKDIDVCIDYVAIVKFEKLRF